MSDKDEALSHAAFWDARYAEQSDVMNQTHEWFRSFNDLYDFFRQRLFAAPGRLPRDNPQILHLGCGDSTIPPNFAARGYRRQLCVDFSAEVIRIMAIKYQHMPTIRWQVMDVRQMTPIPARVVDVAFDKGTLDAMIHGSPWSPPDAVKDNTSQYLREVHRVLKDDGVFLYVTFRQPHFIRPLLDAGNLWQMEMEVLGGTGASFNYYGWILKKASPPQVL